MAVVRLPDGRLARFPDGIPREEIKAFIEFKFPEAAGGKPVTADTLMGLARTQFEPPPADQPVVEGNPYASSLPGPLGQFQNSSRAFHNGMIEGATGNLSNEIVSGALAVPDAIGSAIQGNGFDVGQSFNNLYAFGQDQAAGAAALNPSVSRLGNLTGAVVLGKELGGFIPTATTPLGLAAAGAVEGGALGALYGAGGAEGGERITQGLSQAGWGALGGGAIGFGAGSVMQPISQEAKLLARGLEGDGIVPSAVAARVSALGPDGILGDIGPNLQAQTAAIATLPGQGSRTVMDALNARRLGANARIKNDVAAALGPSPRLSQVQEKLNLERQQVNQAYEPVFQAKALSSDPFLDATPIIASIDQIIPRVVGKTRSNIEAVKRMLIDPTTGKPTVDPQVVMAVRQELDGMIGAETNTTTARVLGDLRKVIDADLGNAVPGLKAVDAQFEEVARQGDALERGRAVLNDGKTAINPADLVEEMIGMSSGQQVRLSEGVRSEIDRIIGTAGNDRVKLRDIVRGEGSWNAEKLRTVLGDERTEQLLAIIEREATMAATENLATSGSRTQVLQAAQDDVVGRVNDPGVMREALNFQYGNAAARLGDKLMGGALARRRAGVISNVAEALVGKGLSPKMSDEINRLLSGASARDKSIISALIAGQAAR